MKEILITSSVLILAILAIRFLFRDVLSRRFQYALWALVLVRLLVPVSLPAADFSILTATEPVQAAVTTRLGQVPAWVPGTAQGPGFQAEPVQLPEPAGEIHKGSPSPEGRLPLQEQTPASDSPTLGEMLTLLWKVGMVGMAAFFLISNLGFYRALRKNRREWTGQVSGPYEAASIRQRVYVVDDGVIPSPCLFGNAIYITPAVAADPHRLAHVLTHEATHAKHLDPMWSLLRCLCLTVYWFDPLVWAAAVCSKADCELACDESVLKALGEEERIPYGQTLLSLIPVKRGANPLIAATTMTAGKRQLKDRVSRIAGKSRQLMAAALAVAILAGIVSACTFTGGKGPQGEVLTAQELAFFNEEFFNEGGIDTSNGPAFSIIPDTVKYNVRNMFLTSLYKTPKDIDLHQLFFMNRSIRSQEAMDQAEAVLGPTSGPQAKMPSRMTAEDIDTLLLQYTGTGWEASHKVGVDEFTYSEEYGAYFWFRYVQDTNYPGNVTFTAGTRSGDRVTLYYQLDPESEDWYAVTLEEQEDGSYWFVSNLAAQAPGSDLIPAPENTALYTLTGEELRWFNEEFFNNLNSVQDYTYTIRNQFANPINLYDRPEDIDLYELFYLEGSAPSDEELKTVFDSTWDDLPCAAYKLTTAEIDAILTEYTGLTLEQANKDSLTYEYRPEYDAYFWMHGDTNYCGDLTFTAGTRQGDIYKLYHHGYFDGNRWCCVTLTKQADGGYWFRSNQICAQPAIPTPLPGWEPVATLSLTEGGAYIPPMVTVEYRSAEGFDLTWPNNRSNWNIDGHFVSAALMPDGLVRAAVRREDGILDVFLTVEDEAYSGMRGYDDLFGHSGFCVDYVSDAGLPTRDYYYFTDDGVLTLLLRVDSYTQGGCYQLDLDGDGTSELVNDKGDFFFQKKGSLYHADPKALLTSLGPDFADGYTNGWDIYGKYLTLHGHMMGYKDWSRYLYFDGENLLIYKDEKPTADHMVEGIDKNVPAEVVEQARAFAQQVYEGESFYEGMGQLDDWRVEAFYGPYRTQVGEVTVEAWAFNYECHTTTPEDVVLAGGRYLTEDDWVSPGYPGADYLFFHRKEDGSLTYLWRSMMNDMEPGSWRYGQYLEEKLAELDFDIGNTTFAALDAARKLEYIMDHSDDRVTLLLTPEEGEGAAYTVSPDSGNARYYQQMFTDPEQYRWKYEYTLPGYPEGTSLTITDPTWDYYIRLWEGSNRVMIKPSNDGASWYLVDFVGLPPDDVFYESGQIFSFMRGWFDEAEAFRHLNTALADHGGSPRETATAWLTLYEGSKGSLSPGNRYACSYVQVADAEILEDQPEDWFPPEILDYPHFAFSYRVIFVPENEEVLRNLMAGNTGKYEGNDPSVPQGAYEYSRRGSMYLKDGHWYCAGIGTG